MGTKDLTHEAIARALANGEPLTHDQRAALLTMVADDKVWQRKHDEMAERLGCVRQALPEALRDSVPSVAVATMTAGMENDHTLMRRLIAGIDHLDKLAREWEPDHSSGADRRGWLLAKDARDDAVRALGPNAASQQSPAG